MTTTVKQTGAARFASDAVDGLLIRAGRSPANAQPSAEARRLSTMPLATMAAQCLELAGQGSGGYQDPEALALRALQMGGANSFDLRSEGPAHYRPGDFPNLLSGFANKMLDQALEISGATYQLWTGRVADLPDFKPATVLAISGRAELSDVMEGDIFEELPLAEQITGLIQIGRYGNSVALTPVMVANDDVDGFTQMLQSLSVAHEKTLNRLCLTVIGANVICPDGVQLYNAASHSNDIVPGLGGAPSTITAQAMKLAHRRQTDVTGTARVKSPPKIALVPPAWEEAAMQTFLTFSRLNENKTAITDATVNIHRGTIEPIVEPDLEDYSLTQWYTFADPRIRRSVVHAYQRGYANGGKRSSRFDPARKSQIFDVEGRFAAGIANWRGTVRNAGV
ncbi:MAG: phage major capsid protein [Pirellulaceae bacterium]